MFSLLELNGQSSQDKHGSIRLNTYYDFCTKPVWMVLLKLAIAAGMLSVGALIVGTIVSQFLPPLKMAGATAVILVLYVAVAFFFRPQANTDNMGWGLGLANDPFQYSDNINRFLFKLHMLLGPGRFCSETLLDARAMIGLVRTAQPSGEDGTADAAVMSPQTAQNASAAMLASPVGAPRADRFDFARGQQTLDSWKYFSPGQRPPESTT
jgi:hypothetical protein